MIRNKPTGNKRGSPHILPICSPLTNRNVWIPQSDVWEFSRMLHVCNTTNFLMCMVSTLCTVIVMQYKCSRKQIQSRFWLANKLITAKCTYITKQLTSAYYSDACQTFSFSWFSFFSWASATFVWENIYFPSGFLLSTYRIYWQWWF